MVNDFEKKIYNTFLIQGRKANNKPFKIRKNFDDLDEEVVSVLRRLSTFFINYPSIDTEIYFSAPYKLYPDEEYYKLDYFLSPQAKKAYTLYIKSLELEDPDSNNSLKRLLDSLNFVYKYCLENKLQLQEYKDFMVGTLPVFVDHLKHHHITYYTLHALTFDKISVESQILEYIFSEFFSTFQKTKNKFYASKKMKEFAKKAKNKITKQLETKNN